MSALAVKRLSVSVLVYVVALSAFVPSCVFIVAVSALAVKRLSVSVLVYVVALSALAVKRLSVSVLVYVVALSALGVKVVGFGFGVCGCFIRFGC